MLLLINVCEQLDKQLPNLISLKGTQIMKNRDSRILISPKDAAQLLAVSPRKLWSMTFEDPNPIAHVKIGRLVRYPMAVLDRWVTLNTQGVADDE